MADDTQQTQLDSKYDYAKLADGSYAKFPKGTNPVVMQAKLAKAGLIKPKPYAGQVTPAKPQFQLPAYYGFTPKNVAKNIYEGGKGVITSAYDVAKAGAQALPQGLGAVVGAELKKGVFDPADTQLAKAKAEYNNDRLVQAAGHFMAANLPLLGPAAAGVGEQAGKGDIGGAAGQTVGMIATGAIIQGAIKGVSKITPETLRQRAASLDTKVLKTAEAGSKGYGLATGLEVANQHIIATLKSLPAKIEQVRAAMDARVQSLAKYHDAQGTTVDAESGLTQPLRVMAQRMNTQGLLDSTAMKAIRSEITKIQTKIDMSTGKSMSRNLKALSVSDAIELTKGLGKKINWDSATAAVVEPFRKTIRQVINNAIDKVDPVIGKTRAAESRLVDARDAARENYTHALNDKTSMGRSVIYSGMGTISAYLGLRMLGAFPMAAIGSTVMLRALATSTLSRTARAALYARAAEVLERTAGTAQAPPNAAGGPQVPQGGQGPSLPPAGPQTAANARMGLSTAASPQGGVSAPSATGGPSEATSLVTIQRLRASAKPQTVVKPEMDPASQAAWQESMFGEKPPVDVGTKVREANPEPTRAEVKAGGAGRQSGAKSTAKSPEVIAARNKAMLDRLDTLLERQAKPKSAMDNAAIQREIKELKSLLAGEDVGTKNKGVPKRIADRERLAAKRQQAAAEAPASEAGKGGEAVARGGDPELRALALDAGYKALAKYEGGESMANALRATAKAMQRIDPSYDEVEKLTEALQVLKSLPPD